MSRNLRTTIGLIAALLSVAFLYLWFISPKLTDDTLLVNFFGRATAGTVQVILYAVPTLLLIGIALMSFRTVLGKRHNALESSLDLGGRDVDLSDVTLATHGVEEKRTSVLSHRFTCPRCSGHIDYQVGAAPIVCDVDSSHTWLDQRALSDELHDAGNNKDALRLMQIS